MSSYQQQRETRIRIIFTVAITYGLIRLARPTSHASFCTRKWNTRLATLRGCRTSLR